MNSNVTNELSRLMLVTPSTSLEVAVPSDVPLYDLFPTLLSYAGPDLADAGVEHDGWVIQRLGEPPLDEERTLSMLAVRDGDTLHLRPRRAELPVIDYDDLITGVADGVRRRPDRWRDSMTRRLFLTLMSLALVTNLAVLWLDGPPLARAGTAGALVLVLLIAAAICSRLTGDGTAAGLLGLAAVLFAALAGHTVMQPPGGGTDPAQILAAGAAALVTVLVGMGLVARWLPAYAAALAVSFALALGGLLSMAGGLNRSESAAVVLVVALVFNATVPMTSFRLADLRLPLLPTNSDELQQEIEPERAARLLDRAVVADQYMTALFTAVGLVSGAALLALAPATHWGAQTLYGAACLTLLLRSRVLAGAGQRIALLAPAALALAVGSVGLAAALPPELQPAGPVLVLTLLAGLLLTAAAVLPGRRLVPYWGRAAEIGELLTGLVMLPALLAVLDAYDWARALFG
ncbi:type VII secretion integral membrane protein EccD [Streptomyces sp. NPDC002680]|uniref:type VII secretion integral membrane protein EccD n=1 Tax=Streptomyces sp. NPDC002680 TaxID=3364659 RepID=UPI0036BD65EC